jgi:uncharacterized protein (TIGR03435 family)
VGGALPSPLAKAAAAPVPDIFEALEKQLGLKLVQISISLDTLVIDHAEKVPTGN